MSVKILTSTVIGLEAFRQDPIGALSSAESGAVAVFGLTAMKSAGASGKALASAASASSW